MTTIIYKNGVVYADTQTTVLNKDNKIIDTEISTKIHRIKRKVIAEVGCTKISDLYFSKHISSLFMRLFKRDFQFTNYPITLPGTIVEIDKNIYRTLKIKPRQFKVTKNWYLVIFYVTVNTSKVKDIVFRSEGSGSLYAKEYLDKGLCPAEAIKQIAKQDDFTNDQITIIKV